MAQRRVFLFHASAAVFEDLAKKHLISQSQRQELNANPLIVGQEEQTLARGCAGMPNGILLLCCCGILSKNFTAVVLQGRRSLRIFWRRVPRCPEIFSKRDQRW